MKLKAGSLVNLLSPHQVRAEEAEGKQQHGECSHIKPRGEALFETPGRRL